MNKIKIISNPYEKRVLFERWNNQLNSWTSIDEDSNSNSKLICSEYQIGFFPFKVYEIINQIITEYSNPDDVLSICFSGSDDEYQELERLVTDIKFENIQLEKSENYLENARDVLPEINRIFQKLDPLITKNIEDESGEIQQQLKRFSDASNDIIPSLSSDEDDLLPLEEEGVEEIDKKDDIPTLDEQNIEEAEDGEPIEELQIEISSEFIGAVCEVGLQGLLCGVVVGSAGTEEF